MDRYHDDRAERKGVIEIVPVTYVCRKCETARPIHVSPKTDGERLVIDVDGYHRLVRVGCDECGGERTHVAAVCVPDRVAETGY